VKFWILWGIDAVVAVIVLYFFVVGLADGSVSSFNFGLWALILLGLATIMGGSVWLKAAGRPGIATLLLLVLALPGLLFGLFVLAILIANPRWN
jgi:hypothetical protein